MSAHARTILLVEDNPDDVELTVHAFRKSELDSAIIVVGDGEQALEYLSRHSGPENGLPAVVLLDLKLPGISGFDVLRRVRAAEATRRLPVVILTTSDDAGDMADGYDLGANSYIQKPVDFGAFTRVVDQVGLYWLTVNTPAPH